MESNDKNETLGGQKQGENIWKHVSQCQWRHRRRSLSFSQMDSEAVHQLWDSCQHSHPGITLMGDQLPQGHVPVRPNKYAAYLIQTSSALPRTIISSQWKKEGLFFITVELKGGQILSPPTYTQPSSWPRSGHLNTRSSIQKDLKQGFVSSPLVTMYDRAEGGQQVDYMCPLSPRSCVDGSHVNTQGWSYFMLSGHGQSVDSTKTSNLYTVSHSTWTGNIPRALW